MDEQSYFLFNVTEQYLCSDKPFADFGDAIQELERQALQFALLQYGLKKCVTHTEKQVVSEFNKACNGMLTDSNKKEYRDGYYVVSRCRRKCPSSHEAECRFLYDDPKSYDEAPVQIVKLKTQSSFRSNHRILQFVCDFKLIPLRKYPKTHHYLAPTSKLAVMLTNSQSHSQSQTSQNDFIQINDASLDLKTGGVKDDHREEEVKSVENKTDYPERTIKRIETCQEQNHHTRLLEELKTNLSFLHRRDVQKPIDEETSGDKFDS